MCGRKAIDKLDQESSSLSPIPVTPERRRLRTLIASFWVQLFPFEFGRQHDFRPRLHILFFLRDGVRDKGNSADQNREQ